MNEHDAYLMRTFDEMSPQDRRQKLADSLEIMRLGGQPLNPDAYFLALCLLDLNALLEKLESKS
ncbi:hypothetical protein [Herbaspirillum huttiense]|uniref:hypothetical protein n=1 Tax=Herbaspirillum huttiense TaxID=863372 RepID=UPI002E770095|nr:hypothetical protein [Herbaspirillum huttiense]MEE1636386.1 hypothetical protein [Herbaspirillum huttiense NC40101]